MNIIVAKTAGFCMGVRRAVEMALDSPAKYEGPISTYGPLIHNPHVLNILEEKGISILNQVPSTGPGTVIIRAHGVPPSAKEKLKNAGFRVIDATCPRVIKVQTIIRQHAAMGWVSIIIGDRDHPEVMGLLGYAGEKGYTASSLEDLKALPEFDKAIVVAQTTQNTMFFDRVKKWTAREHPGYKVFDTICDSTEKRQEEVKNLADAVDAVIVVGGYTSGNTRRLAEIARQSGKTVYHVESEADIEAGALDATQTIGITAGASTPNWIIKRVYRAVEALPYKKGRGRSRLFFAIQRALLLTNIYVAIGAGSLCYACTKLLGVENYLPYVLISILYVQSMHILNNLIGRKADRYNDPDRGVFYENHKVFLSILAISSGAAGLVTAFIVGKMPFLIILAMSLMGLSYNLRLVPGCFPKLKCQKIRDIPGSKTILIAAAWGVVTALFPSLSFSGSCGLDSIIVFLWSAGMVLARTAFFEILDMQGDRIVGKETIPILLGAKTTLRLLKAVLVGIFLLFLLSSALGIVSCIGLVLCLCPVFLFVILTVHERGHMLPGMRLEFLVESIFVSTGLITLVGANCIR
ncbi:MAG: 4-hydroxy-3-methylbut-2-enyl diphosphate reductase [Deltaproteobacteria bacterium]|nr:4-hydroxy-3-methylbut-2-enyl diphosphate reductase [Deltaproteobacteria bacterium]